MAGRQSQRFVRDDDSSVAIEGVRLEAELLQRLEDQAAALAETKSRLAMVESALEAERKGRQELGETLRAERAKVERLGGPAKRSQAAASRVSALEDELGREKANSESMALRLEEAWVEIRNLNQALSRPRGILRRRRADQR